MCFRAFSIRPRINLSVAIRSCALVSLDSRSNRLPLFLCLKRISSSLSVLIFPRPPRPFRCSGVREHSRDNRVKRQHFRRIEFFPQQLTSGISGDTLFLQLMLEPTMSCLIDGLPDAVVLRCLARVPLFFHHHMQLVCRSWREALKSPEISKVRREIAGSEEFLCVLAFEPENVWQIYDPCRDLWMTLPVLPTNIRHLARFGVTSINGKLFVLGGGSDRVDPSTGDHDGIFATNEVWSYDPLIRQWSKKAPMLVPRAMFACCALNGRIVVAGGFTNCRKMISQAEIYDPEKDMWHALPDLCHTRNSACSGVVVDGKMHVLHKGLSMVQILDENEHRWVVEDYGWLQGLMAVVGGQLYVLSNGLILKQTNEQGPRPTVTTASEFHSRIGFGMIGVGNDIYIIGGVIGPGRTNQCIKQLSDVDVLDVASERPQWRQVAPMTRSRGSILGCSLLRV